MTLVAPCPAKATPRPESRGEREKLSEYVVSVKRSSATFSPTTSRSRVRRPGLSAGGGCSGPLPAGGQAHFVLLRQGADFRRRFGPAEYQTCSTSWSSSARGVDFIECRACDLGCIGGTGTYDPGSFPSSAWRTSRRSGFPPTRRWKKSAPGTQGNMAPG